MNNQETLETKSDFRSGEEWAKNYRPIKRSGDRPARVGGTLFDDLSGTEGKYVHQMDREFVWSVFSNGYFEYIQNGLTTGAIGYLVSDNPERFKDQHLRFAIGYDGIDWDAFERFQNGGSTVVEEANTEEFEADGDNLDGSIEAVTAEPVADPVGDEVEAADREPLTQDSEALAALPEPEAADLPVAPHETEEEALTAIAIDSAVAEEEHSSAEYEYPPAEPHYPGVAWHDPYLETDPAAVEPVEPLAEVYSGEVQPDETQQSEPDVSYDLPTAEPETETVEHSPIEEYVEGESHHEFSSSQVESSYGEFEQVPALVQPEQEYQDPSECEPPTEYQNVQEAIAEAPQQRLAEPVVLEPEPAPPQVLIRELPFGYEAARLDFDIYGGWPGAFQCKSCRGNGFYAGVRMCGIECPDCVGRGWNIPHGSPHEIQVVVR